MGWDVQGLHFSDPGWCFLTNRHRNSQNAPIHSCGIENHHRNRTNHSVCVCVCEMLVYAKKELVHAKVHACFVQNSFPNEDAEFGSFCDLMNVFLYREFITSPKMPQS